MPKIRSSLLAPLFPKMVGILLVTPGYVHRPFRACSISPPQHPLHCSPILPQVAPSDSSLLTLLMSWTSPQLAPPLHVPRSPGLARSRTFLTLFTHIPLWSCKLPALPGLAPPCPRPTPPLYRCPALSPPDLAQACFLYKLNQVYFYQVLHCTTFFSFRPSPLQDPPALLILQC